MCIATYTLENQPTQAEVCKSHPDDSDQILVVDDLVDTAKMFEAFRGFLPNAIYAALYYKPQGEQWLDYVVTMTAQDVGVVFPWEENI